MYAMKGTCRPARDANPRQDIGLPILAGWNYAPNLFADGIDRPVFERWVALRES
jgi:hypothetical protein